MGQQAVRITVMNVEEDGTLTLSPDDPNAGSPVEATITDPDSPDGVIVTNWKWAAATTRVASFGDATLIPTATMYKYTGKQGEFLWAMVDYRDGASVEDDPVTVLDERNDNPDTTAAGEVEQHKFQDRNDDGNVDSNDNLFHNSDEMLSKGTDNAVQKAPPPPLDPTDPGPNVVMISTAVKESVPSTGYVGVPLDDLLKAIDKDLTLAPRNRIGGPDAASFVFAEDKDLAADNYYDEMLTATDADADTPDKGTQLALGFPVTDLDYDADGAKTTYTIEVTERNAATAISTVRVTISVLNVNEAPTAPAELRGPAPVRNTAPMFDMASTTMMVAENSAAGTVVGMVMATDADRGDTLTYTLGGDHAMYFDIDDMGNIMVGEGTMLDYESDMMYYMVDVMATDSEGETAMIYGNHHGH